MSRSFLESAFGQDSLLGAPVLRQLQGYPTKDGRLRAGRLSTELRRATQAGKGRGSTKGRGATGGAFARRPRGTPSGGAARPMPRGTPSGAAARMPPRPGAGAPMAKGPIAPGRAGVQTFARTSRTAALSGLEDVPFKANGSVWVTVEELPLMTFGSRGTIRDGAQLLWPDGTPVVSRFWFPKLALPGFSPIIEGTYDQGPHWSVRKGQQEAGAGAWFQFSLSDDYYGQPDQAWTWGVDYACGQMPEAPLPKNRGDQPFHVLWTEEFHNKCQSVDNLWIGKTKFRWYFGALFDWSRYPATVAAPIWLWNNLFDPTNVSCVAFDAEIYRADRARVDTAGEPTELPGRAWLALEFLDAIVTGAHGMPILVGADGALDVAAFSRFKQANPQWAPLLTFGKTNQGMLAIINDVGAVPGTVVRSDPGSTGGVGTGMTPGITATSGDTSTGGGGGTTGAGVGPDTGGGGGGGGLPLPDDGWTLPSGGGSGGGGYYGGGGGDASGWAQEDAGAWTDDGGGGELDVQLDEVEEEPTFEETDDTGWDW